MLSFEHVNFVSLMENIPKIIMTIQTILFPLQSFKHTKIKFQGVSIHLGGSFDGDFTPIIIFEFKNFFKTM